MVADLPDGRGRAAHHSARPQSTKHNAVFGASRPGCAVCVILSTASIWSNPISIDRPYSNRVRTPAIRLQAAPGNANFRRPLASKISASPSSTNPTAVLATIGLKDGPARVKPGMWKTQPVNASAPRMMETPPAGIRMARTPKVSGFGLMRRFR